MKTYHYTHSLNRIMCKLQFFSIYFVHVCVCVFVCMHTCIVAVSRMSTYYFSLVLMSLMLLLVSRQAC